MTVDPKRPRDPYQLAKSIIDMATGFFCQTHLNSINHYLPLGSGSV